jgi:hypothetical protein
MAAHEKHCKKNPNGVPQNRTWKAGVKKGNTPWNKGKRTGRNKCWDERYPFEDVMVENSTYSRYHLRKRLIRTGLVKYECVICGQKPEWMGQKMALVLDHINGIPNDHRRENLRFVCANCNIQLPTHGGKNIGRKS